MRAVYWILFALGLCEVAMLALVARSAHETWPPTRVGGMCLLLLVFAWVALARMQLGSAFSVTPQARQLVTTGLYSRIRNPIYFASPFLITGISLVLMQGWPMLLLIPIVPVQVLRARREEGVLRNAFGAEYDRYHAQTWF